MVQFLGHPAGLALIPVINWRYINHLITGLITPLRRVFKIGGLVHILCTWAGGCICQSKCHKMGCIDLHLPCRLYSSEGGGKGMNRMEGNMMYLGMEDIAVGRVKERDRMKEENFGLTYSPRHGVQMTTESSINAWHNR